MPHDFWLVESTFDGKLNRNSDRNAEADSGEQIMYEVDVHRYHEAFPGNTVDISTVSSINRGDNKQYNTHTVEMATELIGQAYCSGTNKLLF